MSGMYGLVRRLIMVGTVVGLVPGAAWAQGTGIVAGTVTDQTGGVLPGTSVDIRPEGAQRVLETVTDSTGAYRFENLPPGPAELTFRLIKLQHHSPGRHNLCGRHGDRRRAHAGGDERGHRDHGPENVS